MRYYLYNIKSTEQILDEEKARKLKSLAFLKTYFIIGIY